MYTRSYHSAEYRLRRHTQYEVVLRMTYVRTCVRMYMSRHLICMYLRPSVPSTGCVYFGYTSCRSSVGLGTTCMYVHHVAPRVRRMYVVHVLPTMCMIYLRVSWHTWWDMMYTLVDVCTPSTGYVYMRVCGMSLSITLPERYKPPHRVYIQYTHTNNIRMYVYVEWMCVHMYVRVCDMTYYVYMRVWDTLIPSYVYMRGTIYLYHVYAEVHTLSSTDYVKYILCVRVYITTYTPQRVYVFVYIQTLIYYVIHVIPHIQRELRSTSYSLFSGIQYIQVQ